MKAIISWSVLFLIAALSLQGCSGDAKQEAAPKAQAQVAVEVLAVTPQEVVQGVEVVGTLAPKFQAEVKSEVPGKVTDVLVTQWVRVAKGQPLARVDARELDTAVERARAAVEAAKASEETAKAIVLEARVAADRAEREYQRLLNLKDAGLATQQSLDEGLTAREAAKARIGSAQAQVSASRAQVAVAGEDVRQAQTRLSKATIRAPMNGVISERHVSAGDSTGDRPLFRIVDPAVLELTVTVPSRELASVRIGQPLTFSTDAVPGQVFTGKVMYINPSVDPADRSVRVSAEVANAPERLKGGLFVRGRIITGRRRGIEVPRTALLGWDAAAGQGFVFVADGRVARRRAIRTGAVGADRIEVAQGLAPGDAVITRGAFNLKDGDPVLLSSSGDR